MTSTDLISGSRSQASYSPLTVLWRLLLHTHCCSSPSRFSRFIIVILQSSNHLRLVGFGTLESSYNVSSSEGTPATANISIGSCCLMAHCCGYASHSKLLWRGSTTAAIPRRRLPVSQRLFKSARTKSHIHDTALGRWAQILTKSHDWGGFGLLKYKISSDNFLDKLPSAGIFHLEDNLWQLEMASWSGTVAEQRSSDHR